MADEPKNEPSAQTKALLERTRAAKAAAGEAAKTVTVIEDAKPTKKTKTPEPQPPVDNNHVAEGAELFAQTVTTPSVQKKATEPTQPPQAPIPPFRLPDNFVAGDDPAPVVSNDEFKTKTRTMSRTEAEQERGRQIIEKNQQARRRAEAAQRESDENERG